jgi:transcriptional regulator with XRE-family HTH domain
METRDYTNMLHMGRKIERVRRLRGMTQTELGDALKITKQAVSKMEQTENIDDGRLEGIASALGVTVEGLKKFQEETVLYNTINFYENCGVSSASINAHSEIETLNNFPIEKTIEMFEKLLQKEREKYEEVKKGKK